MLYNFMLDFQEGLFILRENLVHAIVPLQVVRSKHLGVLYLVCMYVILEQFYSWVIIFSSFEDLSVFKCIVF